MNDPFDDLSDSAPDRAAGDAHAALPMALALEWPFDVHELDDAERGERVEADGDWCILDGERHFLRGCLEVPLRERAQGPFVWGVWVELGAADFAQTMEEWDVEGREHAPPFLGQLANGLPCYPETRGLYVHVHTRPVGMRPLIELPPDDHPLAVEQHGGIDLARVHEILDACL
jgi:hypothetical protein